MKMLSRDFTLKEKILVLLLILVLLALAYYQFVDQPVRSAIEKAEAENAALETELDAVQIRLAQLKRMQNELDGLSSDGSVKPMPSYNNSQQVNTLLNNVLGDLGYNITFSNVRRNGNQIRRSISLQFTASSYETVELIMKQLSNNEYRCLLENVSCTARGGDVTENVISVTATLTFYETMVGGTPDAGLPADSNATPK